MLHTLQRIQAEPILALTGSAMFRNNETTATQLKLSSGTTASSTATFSMANKDSVQGLKVIARSTKFDVSPLDQLLYLFIFQDGIDSGYLRVPFTVHPTILKEDREGEFDILGTTLADDMARINYSTVYVSSNVSNVFT